MKRILLILSVVGLLACTKEQPYHIKKGYQYKFVCWSEFAGVYYQVNNNLMEVTFVYDVDSVLFETHPGDTIKIKVYTDYPTLGILYENQTSALYGVWNDEIEHTMMYIAK